MIDGVALQAINPKAYAVNTALFAGFTFLPDTPLLEAGLKLIVVNAIWLPIHFAWLGLGIWLRSLDLSGPAQRAINIAMAVSMVLVVGLALFSLR